MDSVRIDRVEGGYIVERDYSLCGTKSVCVSVAEVLETIRDYFEQEITDDDNESSDS